MSPFRITELPAAAAHAVGAGSASGGLLLWASDWAQVAKDWTILVGLLAAIMAVAGGFFYAAYWALKLWAKFQRIRKGDYLE